MRSQRIVVVVFSVMLALLVWAAPAEASWGIFRHHPQDAVNWQTGINQRFTIPFDWGWNQCAIIDAAHLVIDGQFYQGPVFTVIPGPFQGWRVEVIEGQVVIPHPGNFAKRFYERLNVAMQQAQADFVPDGQGGMRPRRESKQLRILWTACPNDP